MHSSREDKTSTKTIITQAQLCYGLKKRQIKFGRIFLKRYDYLLGEAAVDIQRMMCVDQT